MLLLNLPFGYFRGGTERFSIKWLLYIHLPIPFVFFLRTRSGYGYEVIPILLIGAVMGQVAGARYYRERK